MGVISIIQYTAECDYCRDQLDDLYEDELETEEAAKAFGWVKRGFEIFCVDCIEDSDDTPDNN